MLKLLAIASFIGALIVLFQMTNYGTTWYDQICGTQVQFNSYVHLAQTQKNWRRVMKHK